MSPRHTSSSTRCSRWRRSIDPERIAEARAHVAQAGVESLVTIERADVLTVDLTPATVVTAYLSPTILDRLVPQFAKLRPGARVVSHDYSIAAAEDQRYWSILAPFFGSSNELFEAGAPESPARYRYTEHRVYLWIAPIALLHR